MTGKATTPAELYEETRARHPLRRDGTPWPAWEDASPAVRLTWERTAFSDRAHEKEDT